MKNIYNLASIIIVNYINLTYNTHLSAKILNLGILCVLFERQVQNPLPEANDTDILIVMIPACPYANSHIVALTVI